MFFRITPSILFIREVDMFFILQLFLNSKQDEYLFIIMLCL